MCYFAVYIIGVLLSAIFIIYDYHSEGISFYGDYSIFVLCIASWLFFFSTIDIWSTYIINGINNLFKKIFTR